MVYEDIKNAIVDGDSELVAELCQKVLDEKLNAVEAAEKGLIKGVEEVGQLWTDGEAFLPDVMMAAEAMKVGFDLLEKELAAAESKGEGAKSKGKIIIGTVKGDIHDIGKNILSAMLQSAGFDVYDIGFDKEASDFSAKAEEVGADIIGASALLSTTMEEQRNLVNYLKEQNLWDKYKFIIGGGPTSQEWADEIGADGWAETAQDAVALCEKLLA